MAVPTISPQELFRLRREDKPLDLVDVRTPIEFEAVHAQDARLIPLDAFNPSAMMAARNGSIGEPLYFICKSGARADKAAQRFHEAGFANVVSVAGGTTAWEQAGLPVVRGATNVISLERQVRIAAGALVLLGVLLGWLVHPALFGLAAFIGAGLVFAGVTDWCGMAMFLARMPWNQRR